MHELSLACDLVEAASASAAAAGARRVLAVHLRLGALSGVVADALEFGYEVAVEGTVLAGAPLVVELVPALVHCESCGRESELPSPQWLRCPACGAAAVTVVAGRELELVSLEVEV